MDAAMDRKSREVGIQTLSQCTKYKISNNTPVTYYFSYSQRNQRVTNFLHSKKLQFRT